jgi:hypothetical protein
MGVHRGGYNFAIDKQGDFRLLLLPPLGTAAAVSRPIMGRFP